MRRRARRQCAIPWGASRSPICLATGLLLRTVVAAFRGSGKRLLFCNVPGSSGRQFSSLSRRAARRLCAISRAALEWGTLRAHNGERIAAERLALCGTHCSRA
jgi:hypothetical protein